MKNKRVRLFKYILEKAKHEPWMILPAWLLTIRAILFPLDFIAWKAGKKHGYIWSENVWVIHGKEYSDELFLHFSVGGNELFKIIENDNVVCIEKIKET